MRNAFLVNTLMYDVWPICSGSSEITLTSNPWLSQLCDALPAATPETTLVCTLLYAQSSAKVPVTASDTGRAVFKVTSPSQHELLLV
eukprot:1610394-Pleurochrysis_carterae.AAC.1